MNAKEEHWRAVDKLVDISRIQKLSPVFGIIDRDYHEMLEDDEICKKKYLNKYLIFTDQTDMEMMLIFSPAFEKLLRIYEGDEYNSVSLRVRLVNASFPLGVLRFLSQREKYNLWFQDMNYTKFVNSKELAINVSKMVGLICQRTRVERSSGEINLPQNETIIESVLATMKDAEPEYYCNGHDTIEILASYIKSMYGRKSEGNNSQESVFKALVLAYPEVPNTAPFTRTDKKILFWEKAVQSWIEPEENLPAT